ncbi:MAG: ABC transporter ATP-binding protein [Clostridia bacterium]|nr:ABC transporter ATP-binding protein [Clostridia bacterium]
MHLSTIILIVDAVLLLGISLFLALRFRKKKKNTQEPTAPQDPNDTILSLSNVVKVYGEGENAVKALKGIDLAFKRSEFVSVLGPSGCGKTTMLNIIGGLDHYTEGDLIINGVSTKRYKDRDWDTYRNHSVGFVFQSYNLIPHQSVMQNVELALTLSGVPKSARKKRVIEALTKVGLKDQIHKKPNQLSGGQMQRVAIARALVNNPDIILADEPTGALDTETSVQVMELLKEVSKERLVIMVTHNPELAEKYSSRIINMVDGLIKGDSSPVKPQTELKTRKEKKVKKPSMSFFTAFRLSLKNLFTK